MKISPRVEMVWYTSVSRSKQCVRSKYIYDKVVLRYYALHSFYSFS